MLAREYVAPQQTLYTLPDSYPVQHSPELAQQIGTQAEQLLQRLIYWTHANGHERDGKRWTFDSYKVLARKLGQTPKQIRNAVDLLRAEGWINVTNEYNTRPGDRTYWYSVNFAKLDEFAAAMPPKAESRARKGRPYAPEGRPFALEGTALPETPTEIPTKNPYHQNAGTPAPVGGGGEVVESLPEIDAEQIAKNAAIIAERLGTSQKEAQALATRSAQEHPEHGPDYVKELVDDILEDKTIKKPLGVLAWRIKHGATPRRKRDEGRASADKYKRGGPYAALFNRDQPNDESNGQGETITLTAHQEETPTPIDTKAKTKKARKAKKSDATLTTPQEETKANDQEPAPRTPLAWKRATAELASRHRQTFGPMVTRLKFVTATQDDHSETWIIATSDERAECWKAELEALLSDNGHTVALEFGLSDQEGGNR